MNAVASGTRSKLLVLGALLLVVLVVPLLFPSPFHLRVAALVWINAVAALGLALLMGLAGQVSLGHAGFMGIGAYATALGPKHLGLDPLSSMGLGLVAAGWISSTYKDGVAFLVILLVLLAMPQGLLGRRAVERV